MGKATQDLMHEHEAILYVLEIVEKAMADDTKDSGSLLKFYDELVQFLKIFADKCHHGKEEGFLFPELVKRGVGVEGGPIGEMLEEHHIGREYIAQMNKAGDAADIKELNLTASKYRDLLISHIEKENDVLFVMADVLLDAQTQDELFEKFEEHEESVVGHGVHEKLHAMIDTWAEEFAVE